MGWQFRATPLGRKGAGAKASQSWPSLALQVPVVVPLPVTSTSEVPSEA